MKVIHIINSLEIGGAQKLITDLIPLQKRQGVDVSILVFNESRSNFEKKLINCGITILSLNVSIQYNPTLIFKIRKHLKKNDIAHVHLFPALYWVAIASIGLKTELIYTEHSTSNRRRDSYFFQPIERLIYNRYSKIVSISEQTQKNLINWLCPKEPTKFQVIPNGVNLRKYQEAETKSVESLFGRSGIHILMVSRFVPAKDQTTLIKATKFIDNPNVFIAFAGDGELINDAKRISDNLGVDNRCVFLGNRDDIPDLIKVSAVGVQSSHWEGFGLTAVEFMAAGKPIIASSVDGLKQVVEGAGEIFQAGDEKGLAEKINILLADHSYYDSMAEKCRIRATKYDISVMTQQYQKIYQNLCKK